MSEEKMYETHCPTCGVLFGISVVCKDAWFESGHSFYCPNGHGQSWKKPLPEVERLKTEVKELKVKLKEALSNLEDEKKRNQELTLELEIWHPSERSA